MIRAEILPLLVPAGRAGVDLFWGQIPNTPDNAVVVFEYLGSPPDRTKGGMEYGYHPLQVTVRNISYDAAIAKAWQIFGILGDRGPETLGSGVYDWIRARQMPFADPSGKDAGDRFRVLCNYVAKRRAI